MYKFGCGWLKKQGKMPATASRDWLCALPDCLTSTMLPKWPQAIVSAKLPQPPIRTRICPKSADKRQDMAGTSPIIRPLSRFGMGPDSTHSLPANDPSPGHPRRIAAACQLPSPPASCRRVPQNGPFSGSGHRKPSARRHEKIRQKQAFRHIFM